MAGTSWRTLLGAAASSPPLLAAFEASGPAAGARGVLCLAAGAPGPAPADEAAWGAEGGRVVRLPPGSPAPPLAFPLAAPPLLWKEGAGALVFTDGSCLGNGSAGAVGGFSAVFMGPAFGGSGEPSVLRGSVPPLAFAPAPGLVVGLPAASGAPLPPTNIRAEWLGVIFALLGLGLARPAGRLEVVTDYVGCARTLEEWYPARLARGTEADLENLDLIRVAWGLYAPFRGRLRLTHVKGHARAPPPGSPPRDCLLHLGNALADSHAEAGRGLPGVEALGAPLLAPLASPAWGAPL